MAVDRLGETLTLGDDVVVVGRYAHDDAANSRIVVDVHGRPLVVDAARVQRAAALDEFYGGKLTRRHRHAPWYDDFLEQSGRWAKLIAGTGQAFVEDVLGYGAPLDTDDGDGYLRVTNATSAVAGNSIGVIATSKTHWSNFFSAAARRVRWRVLLSHTTAIKASCGLARVTAGAFVPSPGAVFAFDSGVTNVRFRWDNGAGSTGDVDTGISLATFGTTGHWLEIVGGTGGITAYIDGLAVASWTTNLPTGTARGLCPYAFLDANGVTWRGLFLDFVEFIPRVSRFGSSAA